jgi:hypothetical protein
MYVAFVQLYDRYKVTPKILCLNLAAQTAAFSYNQLLFPPRVSNSLFLPPRVDFVYFIFDPQFSQLRPVHQHICDVVAALPLFSGAVAKVYR